MSVTYSTEKLEIYIPDIGVTMRTMLAVAAKGYAECRVRRWHIVYKDVRIGMVSIKTDSPKEKSSDSNERPALKKQTPKKSSETLAQTN
jgi:hypothetical protein